MSVHGMVNNVMGPLPSEPDDAVTIVFMSQYESNYHDMIVANH